MKNAVIVHGMPSKVDDRIAKLLWIKASKFHWLGWLAKKLRENGYQVWAPEMPKPYAPNWNAWVDQAEKAKIGPHTLLVGHSCGGGFWLRYLSDHKELRVGKVVLVAPWIDAPRKIVPDFFNFVLDSQLVKRTNGLTIIYSDNDKQAIKLSIDKIKQELPGVKYIELKGLKHFTISSMHTTKFPELLKECIN